MTVHDLSVELRRLGAMDLSTAATLCTRAMHDNPVHLHVFGADPARLERRLHRFFAAALPYIERKGLLWGAYADERLIGVLGALPPGACTPSGVEMLRAAPRLVMSPLALLRLHRWLNTWRRHDLRDPHWHLGPLAVEPGHRGAGVGSRLLRHCFDRAADAGGALYLETDTPDNVRFYEGFGFSVVATLPVLGTKTWLMRRD